MMKRLEVAGRLTGLIGLGIVFGSLCPSPLDGFILGLGTVVISFMMVVVGKEFK